MTVRELIDWLEKGHSVNETLNGTLHVFKKLKNSCEGDWTNFSNDLIKNFDNNKGYMGTPMRFTKDSLKSGPNFCSADIFKSLECRTATIVVAHAI